MQRKASNHSLQSKRESGWFSIWILLFACFLFPSCNQSQNIGQQNQNNTDTIQSQSKGAEIADADQNGNEETYSGEYAELTDSVMTHGNYVVFFIRNGEWSNEIGAEELANDFSYYAMEAMDSLDGKKFSNSFLIGDEIKIGLENGPAFRITQPDCVMGVVFIASGKQPRLDCGVKSTKEFWNYFNEYYKPNL